MHPKIAWTYSSTATMYQKQKLYQQAESAYKLAIEIYEKTLGENHADCAWVFFKLGELYTQDNRPLQDRFDMFNEAVRRYDQGKESVNPDFARSVVGLVNCQQEQFQNQNKKATLGEMDDMINKLERAIQIFSASKNQDDAEIVAIKQQIQILNTQRA